MISPRLRASVVGLIFVVLACSAQQLPNPRLTPGLAAHTPVATLCNKHFHTRDVRLVTAAMKKKVFLAYGIHCWPTVVKKASGIPACRQWEVDHLVSLELDGANDVRNLWPQPIAEARRKDVLENWLHDQVCSGAMPLQEAQHRIATNWAAEYRRMEAAK